MSDEPLYTLEDRETGETILQADSGHELAKKALDTDYDPEKAILKTANGGAYL